MTQTSTIDQKQLRRLERRLRPSGHRLAAVLASKVRQALRSRSGMALKRAMDLVVAALALFVLSPLFLLVAIAIKLTDGGPVLFWQTRIGKWGQPFRFPKFRSMVVDAERIRETLLAANQHGGDGVTFKLRRDPRVTAVGRIIRKTSIDELPQLWCVLRGEMSLVGPRPALASEVSHYSLDDRARLDALPGLTCTWQVSGRADIPFPEQLRLDLEYIREQSLGKDIELLLKTVPAVVLGRGAY